MVGKGKVELMALYLTACAQLPVTAFSSRDGLAILFPVPGDPPVAGADSLDAFASTYNFIP